MKTENGISLRMRHDLIDVRSEYRDRACRRHRILILTFAVSITILLASCSRGALIEKAQAEWDAGNYDSAAELYEQYLKEHPQGDKAQFARFRAATVCHRNLKQFDRAIQHYIHLIEDYPKSPESYQARLRLAECYAAVQKRRESISEYESVLPITPEEKEKRRIRLQIADLYYDMNDLGQAVAEYQKVTVNTPYDELAERAFLRIGGIRLLRDEFEEAVPAYQAVAQNTTDATIRRLANFGVADCYERTFQFDQAIKTLERTEPDPKSPNYIQQRIAAVREQQRQRNLTTPSNLGWPGKK
ncbi:MAG: tetratricopeptide repeat protein [Acidobacteria bacterium]|nr:tetratricopeptide repeat protein [Acidobacteriota bacterium]